MGIFSFFSKDKKETLDKGLSKTKEIIKSIDSLGDECKRVFRKSRFEHKKNEEIATELGISVNTVKYHIKMALTRLHQDLRKYLILLISFFSL